MNNGAVHVDTKGSWPKSGLETVGRCPVCGSTKRTRLYEGLSDLVFFSADGKWDMYQCVSCTAAYLDPRPTPDTIGRAYQNYFTHVGSLEYCSLSPVRKLKRIFANGYRNWKYGTQDHPSSPLGAAAVAIMPNVRATINAEMRDIPRPNSDDCLLDIGCGNGRFLELARSARWKVIGVDQDPIAVEVARSRGLEILLGDVSLFDDMGQVFNGITMGHVIEHMHDPLVVLRACHRLLKPGGWLWIETPNLYAQGHKIYRECWRGLEPPRHLILFTPESLRLALKQIGFRNIQVMPWRPLCKSLYVASQEIEMRAQKSRWTSSKLSARLYAVPAELRARRNPSVREFITFKAYM